METYETDVVVVGAGAVGLAAGRAFAEAGRETIILEKARLIASETSSRNSEVVHAGFHYTPGSLKAQLCVEGRRALYAYCAAKGVDLRACGKIVVATDMDEEAGISRLLDRARANGVEGCRRISPREALDLEPALNPSLTGALYSETSALVDSHAYFLALAGDIEAAGGLISLGAEVVRGEFGSGAVILETAPPEPLRFRARCVVNCAGHEALSLARRFAGGPGYPGLRLHWAKGNYFSVAGRAAFSRLIYPVDTPSSVGLHLTVDRGGRMRVGPDVEWLDVEGPPFDYRVFPERSAVFEASVRRYWPGLPEGALFPDYSGVRPKLSGPGQPSADFMIDAVRGASGGLLVNLIGIDSPGLTSSLAIGAYVRALAGVA